MPAFIAIFAIMLILNQLLYNVQTLAYFNDSIISIIKYVFNSSLFKSIFKFQFSTKAQNDTTQQLTEIFIFINNNWPYFLLVILAFLIIIKILIKTTIKKIGNTIS
jgi:hypothetical protein